MRSSQQGSSKQPPALGRGHAVGGRREHPAECHRETGRHRPRSSRTRCARAPLWRCARQPTQDHT
eukprot:scaffold27425_cov69-Phaeocystis_antarctica.AAC.4